MTMPRPCQRVRLESGIKLDINRLARGGFIRPGAVTGPVGIGWTDYYGEVIASGLITADMRRTDAGHFRIQLGELDQQIFLVARPRHFCGRQWFFMCPMRIVGLPSSGSRREPNLSPPGSAGDAVGSLTPRSS